MYLSRRFLTVTHLNKIERHVRLLDQAIMEQGGTLSTGTTGNPPGARSHDISRAGGASLNEGAASAHGVRSYSHLSNQRETRRRRSSVSMNGSSLQAPNRSRIIPDGREAPATGPPIPLASADMPIDPHELRYCYCNQVSWGTVRARCFVTIPQI